MCELTSPTYRDLLFFFDHFKACRTQFQLIYVVKYLLCNLAVVSHGKVKQTNHVHPCLT